jgi:hypothetical protein
MEERERSNGETPCERARELAGQIIAVPKSEIDKRGKGVDKIGAAAKAGTEAEQAIDCVVADCNIVPLGGSAKYIIT